MSAINIVPGPTQTPLPPPLGRNQVGWRIARAGAVVATVALIICLVLWPAKALFVMWNLLIPVLPATFLIAPQLWRGICPLATLNQLSNGLFGRRQLRGRLLIAANVVGMLLFALLVPARRFFFNDNGPALAATIVIVALAALFLGALFDSRAGFCNAICPILPVERLYGQHPLLKMDNRRCVKCTHCIPKGCLDIDPAKSIAQAIGQAVGQHHWLSTAYGIFAAALPGFIIGYYTTSDASWSAAPDVYLWVAICSAGSYCATTIVVRVLGLTDPVALALLAALAVALYYWWTVPLIAESLDVPATGVLVGRGAALALVAYWLVQTWPRLRDDRRKVASCYEPAPETQTAESKEKPAGEQNRLLELPMLWDSRLGEEHGIEQGPQSALDVPAAAGKKTKH